MPLLLLALLLLAAPLQAAELKLASWNIAWATGRSAELPPDRAPRRAEDWALLAAYARRLDADIIALQEVDGPEAAARLFDPRAYAFFFPAEDDLQRAGFAIRRSLRAIQNPDLAALDLNPGARYSLRRGTDVTVEGRLRLLSVHLKSGCREGRLDRPGGDCESLGRQARILGEWAAARQAEGIGFAILGDFNRGISGPGDDLLRALGQPILRATEGASDPCWASPTRGARAFIDHILLGGPARGWMQPDSLRVLVYAERGGEWRERLSDHCPLSIRLRLP
jgi:endonuclease/exonuclease/phosphatase family metal-dependent hydrolase